MKKGDKFENFWPKKSPIEVVHSFKNDVIRDTLAKSF